MKYWKKIGFAATIVIIISFPLYLIRSFVAGSSGNQETGTETAVYVGGDQCIDFTRKSIVTGMVPIMIWPWTTLPLKVSKGILIILNLPHVTE